MQNVSEVLPENIKEKLGGTVSEDILALKKDIAKKYIEELKDKKEMGVGKLLIGKGKTLENYLVSENTGDKIIDNIKGNVMDKLFGSVDKGSFVIGGVTYNSVFEYLRPIKEKLDNANTEVELRNLEQEILMASTIIAPTTLPAASSVVEHTGQGQGVEVTEIKRKDYMYPVVDENGNPVKINSLAGIRGPIEGVHDNEHEHKGIDIAASEGTPLLAIADGEVESVGFGNATGFNGYGNYIVIKLKNGYRVLYGHMKEPAEKKDGSNRNVGDAVKKGEQVGLMGSTGMSTGPHLHLEIREGDINEPTIVKYSDRKYFDPVKILPVTREMVNDAIVANVDQSILMAA